MDSAPSSQVLTNPAAAPLAARAQPLQWHQSLVGAGGVVLTQDVALSGFFRGGVQVLGREHLRRQGPLLLAPTHRSRWDALMLPRAAGRRITGRDCRFMVSSDEMVGLQGWFLHRLGCFPVNPRKPAAASLRFAVELLQAGQQLVVFPEGRIQQDDAPLRLMPGLPRLAALAEGQAWRCRCCRWASPTAMPGPGSVIGRRSASVHRCGCGAPDARRRRR